MAKTDSICLIEGCERFVKAKGLCTKHYQKARDKKRRPPKKIKKVWLNCGHCVEPFLVARTHQNRLYCSPKCMALGSRKVGRETNCLHCNKPFRARMNGSCKGSLLQKYCSQHCGFEARKARTADIRRVSVIVSLTHCNGCKRLFVASSINNRWCSKECRQSAHESKLVRACKACDKEFMPHKSLGRRSIFCSAECSSVGKVEYRKAYRQSEVAAKGRRIAKSRRRARTRGVNHESIDPIKVFERDGWRCQLCNKRTPRSLRGKMLADAPELDHIIPLAVGGEHTWSNVQCSCRACNGVKGAKPLGQLRIGFSM